MEIRNAYIQLVIIVCPVEGQRCDLKPVSKYKRWKNKLHLKFAKT